jgi:hypothetical protein
VLALRTRRTILRERVNAWDGSNGQRSMHRQKMHITLLQAIAASSHQRNCSLLVPRSASECRRDAFGLPCADVELVEGDQLKRRPASGRHAA